MKMNVDVHRQLKGSMQEPDKFHLYCFKKNAVKVFSHASVNKVLTKYSKSINRFFWAAHVLKYALIS